MTEKDKEQEGALSLQDMKDFAGQWSEFFSGLQQVLAENELLRQQVQEMKEKDVKREALLQEEKERNTKLEMQLTEMSKMTASVAGKAFGRKVSFGKGYYQTETGNKAPKIPLAAAATPEP